MSARVVVWFQYENYRGESAMRRVEPTALRYGVSPYHTGVQWFLEGVCLDRKEARTFALSSIEGMVPESTPESREWCRCVEHLQALIEKV